MNNDKTDGGEKQDLFQRFERTIRTPRRRLLIDAFLPPPETIASAIPPPVPAFSAGTAEQSGFVQQLREKEPSLPPAEKPRMRKPRRQPAPTASQSLQDEIEEFLNRDGSALAPEVDPED